MINSVTAQASDSHFSASVPSNQQSQEAATTASDVNGIGSAVLSASSVIHPQSRSESSPRKRWLSLTFCLGLMSFAISGGLYLRSNTPESHRRFGQLTMFLGGITLLIGALNIQRARQTVINPSNSILIEDPMAEISQEIERILGTLDPSVNNENNRLILKQRIFNVHHKPIERVIRDRVIVNILEQFTLNMHTISRRIEQDSQWISERFFDGCPLQLQSIQITSAETHNKGQTPCILTFHVTRTDGTLEERKIVYKPRDIRPDALICSKLPVELFSSTGSSPASSSSSPESSPHTLSLFSMIAKATDKEMPTYLFLPMRDQETQAHYGYIEFLTHEETDYRLAGDEIGNYFRMIGKLQALGQIFGIYDLHNANINAHRKLPHPTDLETSFDPIRTHNDTALHLAVTDFEGDGLPTQNRVILIGADGQEYDHPLISPFREEVLASIEAGFNEICQLCREHEGLQRELMEFLDRLPEDLTVRFVPIGTTVLTNWLERISPFDPRIGTTDYSQMERIRARTPHVITLDRAAHYLLYLTFLFDRLKLNDPNRMKGELSSEIQDKIYTHLTSEIQQLSNDFFHHDVPAMTLRIRNGFITHNTLEIKLYHESLIEIIKTRIVNPPPMFQLFRKELVNFSE